MEEANSASFCHPGAWSGSAQERMVDAEVFRDRGRPGSGQDASGFLPEAELGKDS